MNTNDDGIKRNNERTLSIDAFNRIMDDGRRKDHLRRMKKIDSEAVNVIMDHAENKE